MRQCFAVLGFLLVSLTANAVEGRPKRVFLKADCTGPLGQAVMASLKQEIRASSGYQLATSLNDDGGYGVVLTIYVECSESALPSSEAIVSIASIFGRGTCNGDTCSVHSDEDSLQASLCSGTSGVGCGKDLYTTLNEYMSTIGQDLFQRLSESRK